MNGIKGTEPTPQGGTEPKFEPNGGAGSKPQGGAEPKPEPKFEPNGGAEPKPAGRTYSQEEVDKLLNEQKEKYEGKMSEAEKLANMTAEEKAAYEAKQKEDKLAEREKAVALKELQQTAAEALRERGLDSSIAKILNYTDADSVDKSIKTVEKVIKAAIEKGIDEKLKASGGAPRTGSGAHPANGVEAAFYSINPGLKK